MSKQKLIKEINEMLKDSEYRAVRLVYEILIRIGKGTHGNENNLCCNAERRDR